MKKTVLVTGGNGQLAQCIKDEVSKISEPSNFNWLFEPKETLDICNYDQVKSYCEDNGVDIIVNCAAYTNVDKAETEGKEMAYKINADGPKVLANVVNDLELEQLIHISTNYIYMGGMNLPYREVARPIPINEYGNSKLTGDENVLRILGVSEHNYMIIYTSWLYSEYGDSNFVKKIIKQIDEGGPIKCVDDQRGTPTYARNLAKFIINAVTTDKHYDSGRYNYSDKGEATWYEFACKIAELYGKDVKIRKTRTPADALPKRPKYAVLSREKTEKVFGDVFVPWEQGLEECMKKIKNS